MGGRVKMTCVWLFLIWGDGVGWGCWWMGGERGNGMNEWDCGEVPESNATGSRSVAGLVGGMVDWMLCYRVVARKALGCEEQPEIRYSRCRALPGG